MPAAAAAVAGEKRPKPAPGTGEGSLVMQAKDMSAGLEGEEGTVAAPAPTLIPEPITVKVKAGEELAVEGVAGAE